MKPRLIKEYLPKDEPQKLLQANIDEDLLEKVRVQKDKDGLQWKDLIEACFKRYLDEAKTK